MSGTPRRRFLTGLGALGGAALLPRPAAAIGDGSKLQITQLKYTGNWDPRPMAPLVLAQEVRFRTSIDVHLKRSVLELDDDSFFAHPFVVLIGDGRFRLGTRDRGRLKKWIEAGGFLFIDNAGRSGPSDHFDAAVRSELSAMFPGRDLIKIPPSHVLYRTFYVLDFPAGRAIHRTFLEGLFLEDRLAVLYSQNDLSGALDRNQVGGWTFDVVPGGEGQREKAKRLGVNIVQYAMCLGYKDDQVHLDYLLHRRRWRIRPPRINAPRTNPSP